MKKRVLDLMKPKCAKLGFSKEELNNAADRVAGKFNEESTDEEINAEIDAVIPYLEIAQSAANRVINASRKPEGNRQEPTGSTEPEKKPEGSKENNPEPSDVEKAINAAFEKHVKPVVDRLDRIETAGLSQSLAERVRDGLKDVDEDYYQPFLEGRQFTSEDEATAFVEQVQGAWKTFSEKHASAGLGISVPGKAGAQSDDIDGLVSVIEKGTKDKFENK